MRPSYVILVAALGGMVLAAASGCGGNEPARADSTAAASPSAPPTSPRDQLAGAAAAAKDRDLLALYTLRSAGREDRTVTVVRAQDGSWRVDIPGGALGGTADVAIVRDAEGLYQCGLPSISRPEPSTCVRVAEPDGQLEAATDPRVQHPFTDWPNILTDPRVALSVSIAKPLAEAQGTCYSVESTSASLAAPVDPGVYCYQPDGTLTAARLGFGTLTLTAPPGAAPARVDLPGPVVSGDPMSMQAPPEPPAGLDTPAPGST
ncbi:hypothetical protein [Rhizomonospora bruguierae]|uniref:hypothetical protein n=1 Tax=Rhizomonospora bruguierae TaxID=1581705 RepID=UPI0020C09C4B|nr:hypothetical protein [Micromonospora sp. NBRC 107566]